MHQRYFPRYLLKTLQDWFAWHGEDLYDELKHIRNQLHDIHHLLNAMHTGQAGDIVAPLAAAHAVLARRNHRKSQPAPEQLNVSVRRPSPFLRPCGSGILGRYGYTGA